MAFEGKGPGALASFLVASVVLVGMLMAAPAASGTLASIIADDTVDPTVEITMPNSLGYATTNMNYIYLGGFANDDIGVTSVTWSMAGGSSGTATGTTYWETGSIPLTSGSNVITVTAYDAAGNSGTDTFVATFTPVDTTDPQISITTPTSDPSFSVDSSSSPALGGTYYDDVAVTSITWSNAATGGSGTATFSGGNWQIASMPLDEGGNIITVTAYDAAGNYADAVIAIDYSPEGSSDTGGLSLEMILLILAIIVIMIVIILYLLRKSRRGG